MVEKEVAVVIPTRNRGALIEKTILTLLASDYRNFTIWVVDQSENNLTFETVRRLQHSDSRVNYHRSKTVGSSAARNEGIALCAAPFILFTDDDCLVTPEWMLAMCTELQDIGSWAVFGQVVADEDDRPDSIKDSPWLNVAVTHKLKKERFGSNRLNLGFGHGASMGFRREALQITGGFDPLLGAGGALRSWPERDIGYRIMRSGGEIIYTPEAIVYHRQWRDWQEVVKAYKNYGFGTGAAVSKYVRNGDFAAIYIFVAWILDQGLRQVVSGIVKWRDVRKIQLGLIEMSQPWVGLVAGMRYKIDHESCRYEYCPVQQPISDQRKTLAALNE